MTPTPPSATRASVAGSTPERISGARVVYKYPLAQPLQRFAVRAGAVFLHVAVVKGQPTVWLEQPADAPEMPEELWTLRAVGTGHRFTETPGQEYLGSGHCVETGLVWHVYLIARETR